MKINTLIAATCLFMLSACGGGENSTLNTDLAAKVCSYSVSDYPNCTAPFLGEDLQMTVIDQTFFSNSKVTNSCEL